MEHERFKLDRVAFRLKQQMEVLRYRFLRPGGCRVGVVATAGATTVVPLVLAEPDANYGVNITPSWGTTVFVTGKTTTQFTANFGTGANGTTNVFDWHIFRKEP